MRTKEKGVSTTVIGIVVVIIVVAAATVVFLIEEEGIVTVPKEEGIVAVPVYPGAAEMVGDTAAQLQAQGLTLPAGVDAKLYSYTADTADVISWYKTEMPTKNWTMEQNFEFSETLVDVTVTTGMLYFEKAGQASFIMVTETVDNGTLITLGGSIAALEELEVMVALKRTVAKVENLLAG